MGEKHQTPNIVECTLKFDKATMADPAAIKLPSNDSAAIISKQLAALILNEEETCVPTTVERERRDFSSIPPTPESSLEKPSPLQAALHRRPLFNSMREALESSGQVKKEPGGYVIKRHSGRQQPPCRLGESEGKFKNSANRYNKQRSHGKGSNKVVRNPAGDEADAAGYTVIRRRSSCDANSLDDSATASNSQSTGRRNSRASHPTRVDKKLPLRSRRGSMSSLSQSSNVLASDLPAPSSSVPPGFQPGPATSRVVIRPPSGLTPAASGWVAKASVPAVHSNRIEEPPVEALWPEVKSTSAGLGKTESGWDVTASIASDLVPQTWTVADSSSASNSSSPVQFNVVDDDLLGRLGVTL